MAWKPTDSTLIGGFQYTFVETLPDHLVCKICDHPSRDPHLSVCCGYTFCRICIENVEKATNAKACPICSADSGFFVPNKQVVRELKSLQVICPNKEEGCEWQGNLDDISKHLRDVCEYENIRCLNPKCIHVSFPMWFFTKHVMMQRRHIHSHILKDCQCFCEYCNEPGYYYFIAGKHKEECPKLPLACPNLNCEEDNIPSEDMEQHRKECPFEVIRCEYHNVGCRDRMMRKNKRKHEEEYMEQHLRMTKAKLSETETKLTAFEMTVNHFVNSDIGSSDKMIASAHSSIHLTTSIAMSCPVTVRMSHYSKYQSCGARWHSDFFYSHNRGYKMNLVVDAGRQASSVNTYMSVYLFILKGEYDDELSWPLRGTFTIKLLNQMNDDQHFVRTVIYDGETKGLDLYGNGKARFISSANLYKVTPSCQFIRKECIFLQVNKV